MVYQFHCALAKMLCEKQFVMQVQCTCAAQWAASATPLTNFKHIKRSKMPVQPSAFSCGPLGRTTIYRDNGITDYEFWKPKRTPQMAFLEPKSAHHFDSYPSPSITYNHTRNLSTIKSFVMSYVWMVNLKDLSVWGAWHWAPIPPREWQNLRPYNWRSWKISQMCSGCVAMCSHV